MENIGASETKNEVENVESLPAINLNYRASVRAPSKVDSILKMDIEDESLRKYKESLLGSAAKGDLGADLTDPRKLIVTEFTVAFSPEENRPDIVHNLDSPEGLARLNTEGIKIKEGSKYKFRISFRVQHEIIAGIRFIQRVSTKLMSDEDSLMIGSYPPSSQPFEFQFPKFGYNDAPSGMLYRGKYQTNIKFVDSDNTVHLEFPYTLEITKTW